MNWNVHYLHGFGLILLFHAGGQSRHFAINLTLTKTQSQYLLRCPGMQAEKLDISICNPEHHLQLCLCPLRQLRSSEAEIQCRSQTKTSLVDAAAEIPGTSWLLPAWGWGLRSRRSEAATCRVRDRRNRPVPGGRIRLGEFTPVLHFRTATVWKLWFILFHLISFLLLFSYFISLIYLLRCFIQSCHHLPAKSKN